MWSSSYSGTPPASDTQRTADHSLKTTDLNGELRSPIDIFFKYNYYSFLEFLKIKKVLINKERFLLKIKKKKFVLWIKDLKLIDFLMKINKFKQINEWSKSKQE